MDHTTNGDPTTITNALHKIFLVLAFIALTSKVHFINLSFSPTFCFVRKEQPKTGAMYQIFRRKTNDTSVT